MNTLKRAAELLQNSAEEIEAPDGLSICVGIDAWNEFFEAFNAELERAQAEPVNQQMLAEAVALLEKHQKWLNKLPVPTAGATYQMMNVVGKAIDTLAGMAEANNQADPVSTPGLYAVLFRDNWDGESDVYHMLAELIDSGKWVDHRSGRELLEYEGDAILKVWPLNDDKATQVPTRDMLMRVAESVRAACFDACNENGGDWAAIHSLDIAEVINDSLSEIIGELGATDAAGQSQQVEPVAGQCKFSCESKWLPCSVDHHYHVLSCPDEWPGYETRLLYTAPQPSSPPGWKLVPVEPTMEMLNAGVDSGGIGLDYHEAIGRFIVAYSAMLAAAPEQEGGA
ncbi:hypothetical protein A9J41_14790 [Laribacter hongkongensis]|uniref:hypothetical protein n=1 Tax=Laribacter hongkongensis TaxID=168471 RepID=UPI0018783CBF|nr:hypothetical protein [Laribacter hongkongensis]MBE5529217.1 hypothetical protein [Laribacter hongkongensis]